MLELYWITRLDAINCVFAVLCSIIAIIGLGALIACWSEYESRNCNHPNSPRYENYCFYTLSKGILKTSIIGFLICILWLMFVPSTKEALFIYGVGETIDYIKNDEKAKQLPDKVINALDRYVDTIANDNINNNE